MRRWLHNHGVHRFCREVTTKKVVGYDTRPKYLVGRDPSTGKEIRIDATVFGGEPIYEIKREHG